MLLLQSVVLALFALPLAWIRPEGALALPWVSLWGASLCDRRVKTFSRRQPMVRLYQVLSWSIFWGSLFWLVVH